MMKFKTETFQNKFTLLQFMYSKVSAAHKSKINLDLIVEILVELEKFYMKTEGINYHERLTLNYDIDYFNGILIEHDHFDIIITMDHVYISTYTDMKVRLKIEIKESTGNYIDIAKEVVRMVEHSIIQENKVSDA